MTHKENWQSGQSEQDRQDARFNAAMASINRTKMDRERQGYVVMAAAMTYGEGAFGNGRFAKIHHAAKLFMIAFTCALPVIFVWAYLL
ncbi:hypothetical protein GCM10007385_07950 [Tateyamaria omphalii]|uniref:hypothetical protein n=1 Tax=Tateyamaria omphalii TaxID=299262 RepID=UPI001678D304|nr:hypothetical protein [Tateyamaria omphalii]GGX42621.1 hypothetical protein GCM10007385_07950 [Tateyamaria omphalii]